MKRSVKKRGFTIVELVIVIGVIAVLAAVLIPTFSGIIDRAKNSAATQEALGAYTEYMIEHAADGNTAEYIFYKTENKVVVLKNGGALDVYETEEEAIKATFDDPETSEDESEGYTLGSVSINGLYFMQSAEQTECAHSYTSEITLPKCNTGGYTAHTCSLCGDSYTDSETAPTGVHEYSDGKCVCGSEEPKKEPTVIALIGNPETKGKGENEDWIFELITTHEDGVYEAIVKRCNSNYPSSDSLHFVYFKEQLLKYDVPEIAKHISDSTKGFELSQIYGDDIYGEIRSTKEGEARLQLPENECRLILDFNNMKWRIEEIE